MINYLIKNKFLAIILLLGTIWTAGYFVSVKSQEALKKNIVVNPASNETSDTASVVPVAPKPENTSIAQTNPPISEKPKINSTAKKKVVSTSIPKNVAVVDPVQYRDITVGVKLTKPAIQLPDNFNHLITKSYDVQISQARAKIADDTTQIATIQLEIGGYNQQIADLYVDLTNPDTSVEKRGHDYDQIDQLKQKIEDDNIKIVMLVNDRGSTQTQLDYYLERV